ncbi:MAG TPA: hypothetical protein VMX74_02725 [Pirellulales bacterium]|nr:hypothetical protein [Pirellulales bacterium]
MTVLAITEMWSKKGGSVTSAQFSPTDLTYQFTRGFQAVTTIGTQEDEILAHIDMPYFGQPHPNGSPAFVTSINLEQVSPIMWTGTVGYTGENGTFEVPTDEVEVEWTDTATTEPVDRAYNGAAIVNVNGEPVDGLSIEVADQVVVITRKFATINTYGIRQYRRATNSDAFLGWPPGTARLTAYQAKNIFKFGAANEGWTVTARIQFREPFANTTAPQAWYARWRQEGYYVNDGGDIRRARDDAGNDVVRPVLLKADGTQETNPANAVFVHTQLYGSLPYSALGLI